MFVAASDAKAAVESVQTIVIKIHWRRGYYYNDIIWNLWSFLYALNHISLPNLFSLNFIFRSLNTIEVVTGKMLQASYFNFLGEKT